ncbi:MAG TPA: SDR family oxidoreductase [Chitinophagaceae bacterium]|nr:SDR family oxidoreductase [Chitinophagaceae bacterium]
MAIVLVTGTSSGIGFGTAKLLAEAGHTVYATMRNPKKSPKLIELAEKEHLPITVLTMDVDNSESVKQAVDTLMNIEGHIDALVNNAGIGAMGSVEETPIDLYREVMETNYLGAIRCIQAVLPYMRQKRAGTIINITSVAGKLWGQSHSPYCASKAALEALSESLAQEVAQFNIKVAIVEPGVIDTAIFSKETEIPAHTHYPHYRRLKALFAAALENHVPPSVVGNVVKDVVEGKSTSFRNPAGPDAEGLIQWRASLTDEEWVQSHNIDDETWLAHTKEAFGIDMRKYLESEIIFTAPA